MPPWMRNGSRDLLPFYVSQSEIRLAQLFQHAQQVVADPKLDADAAWYEARNLLRQGLRREVATLASLLKFAGSDTEPFSPGESPRRSGITFNSWIDSQAQARGAKGVEPKAPWAGDAAAQKIPLRSRRVRAAQLSERRCAQGAPGAERLAKVKLLNSEATPLLNVQDLSELYAYEIVNFVDGKRTVGEIRDAVAAEYGPLPVQLVSDYLEACREAGVIQWK